MKICRTCKRQFVDLQDICPLDDSELQATSGKPPQGLGRVLGSYRLICLLGEGGMGSIYIGAHTRLNRHVAIKLLRPELRNKKENIARFFEEARTINKIKHPNIVESIDLVEDVVDGAYCVLELLRGPDLRSRLAAGALSVDSTIHIGAQIGDALAAVHALDIVHRDLKPDNLILINRGGRDDFVKLIDFGVAQISEERATGIPYGTAAYMAPEQGAGERVDGRADVYSLGVLLFQMATGQHPFPSSSDNEYLLRHADDIPPRPSKLAPNLPRALESLILRCLAKSPSERFASAAAVSVALRAIDVNARARGKTWKWVLGGVLFAGSAATTAVLVPRYLAADAPANAAPQPARAPVAPPVAAQPPSAVASPQAPAAVTVSIASTPPGAKVYRVGESVPLGTTPLTTPVPAEHVWQLRFELAGFQPLDRELDVSKAHELAVDLVRIPVATPATKISPSTISPPKLEPKKPKVQREGVMDPFAQ
ncbi:MAG: Serine/threonine protein kinase [Myxococcales bacterium]|nr:Serine/threonine protein kinase [Myxococcales bacterium]